MSFLLTQCSLWETKNHFFRLPYPTLLAFYSSKSRWSFLCLFTPSVWCHSNLFPVLQTLLQSTVSTNALALNLPLPVYKLWSPYEKLENKFTNIIQTIATYWSKAQMLSNCLQPARSTVNHGWPPLCFLSVRGLSKADQTGITCTNDMQANSDCKK